MAQHKPAPVSKEQLDQATAFWQGFTKLSTYSIIAVCGSLVILAIALL